MVAPTEEAGGDVIRVFVGTDENQRLAYEVLAASIRHHASLPVDIQPLTRVEVPEPKDPALRTRTGFTFRRFAIPALCGYAGRAIYVDADMQVFADIAELWRWPMLDGVSLLYTAQTGARAQKAQYAVLIMDCDALRWDVAEIVDRLDSGSVTYESLVFDFALVPDAAKAATIPDTWNALEWFEHGRTSLIHYTDMVRQPWIYPYNDNGELWYGALRKALETGLISEQLVAEEINAGHVSPDLPRWIGHPVAGVTAGRRDWLPPYLERVRQQRTDPLGKLGVAVRRRTVWAPWCRRLIDQVRGRRLA